MSTKDGMSKKLQSKSYRDAYVGAYIYANIAYQVRALRKQSDRAWDQKELAQRAGMLQPRISAIENPSNCKLNLDTLIRLANAFDVALIVKFAPFGELLNWAESFDPDNFAVASFDSKALYSEVPTQPMNLGYFIKHVESVEGKEEMNRPPSYWMQAYANSPWIATIGAEGHA